MLVQNKGITCLKGKGVGFSGVFCLMSVPLEVLAVIGKHIWTPTCLGTTFPLRKCPGGTPHRVRCWLQQDLLGRIKGAIARSEFSKECYILWSSKFKKIIEILILHQFSYWRCYKDSLFDLWITDSREFLS